MRRALLIYNPASGRRRHPRLLAKILDGLRSGGIQAEPVATGGRQHATSLARDAARRGLDLVIAYGGDGTVRETATGLLGTSVPLGVLPGGTTNVVAAAFGLPRDPVRAARVLGSLEPRSVDVGICGGHPFLMQASSGFESYMMARLSVALKTRLGLAGPLLQALPKVFRYTFPVLQLVADGRELHATGAIVCNISEFGGSYRVAPGGRFDDGELELVLFHGRTPLAVVSFCVDLVRGVQARRRDVEIMAARNVRFVGPAGTLVQIDGDVVPDPHPIDVGLAPERLRALVHPNAAQYRLAPAHSEPRSGAPWAR
jgi:diacylglycerol kinase family enzyme